MSKRKGTFCDVDRGSGLGLCPDVAVMRCPLCGDDVCIEHAGSEVAGTGGKHNKHFVIVKLAVYKEIPPPFGVQASTRESHPDVKHEQQICRGCAARINTLDDARRIAIKSHEELLRVIRAYWAAQALKK